MSHEEETMPRGEETLAVAMQKKRRQREQKAGESASERQGRRLSEEQVTFLEARFGEEKRLELGRKARLAEEVGLDPRQVAVWFQNRRARHKSKQVAEAYRRLKSAHDSAVLEKCHLENEVLSLRGKLLEAREEIVKLSAGGAGSPSSSSLTWKPLMADMGAAEEEALELMDAPDLGFDLDKFMMELDTLVVCEMSNY